jgi:mono/diheme cytochrome c family protein
MRKTRTAMTLCLASIAGSAIALPNMVGEFQKAYKIPKGSALATAACATCHIRGTKLNPYGKDLKKAMSALKTKKLTPLALKKVAALDSDKDGVKNIAEIKAGTLPGDPKSK